MILVPFVWRSLRQGKTFESCHVITVSWSCDGHVITGVVIGPLSAVFHPSCVDEWLRKWNRTCPLCKSTIQRRGRGGGTTDPLASSSSSTTNQEHSRLLSHEESEVSQQPTVERRETDNYGAIGHSDNPLSPDHRGDRERGRSILSGPDSTQTANDRGQQSNLVRNGNTDVGRTTTENIFPDTSCLEEKA